MLAKGKVYITHDKLKELLGLPKDVEIVTVDNLMNERLEMNIISPKPVHDLTREAPNWNNLRRVHRPIEPVEPLRDFEICDCPLFQHKRYRKENSRLILCSYCDKAVSELQAPVELRFR